MALCTYGISAQEKEVTIFLGILVDGTKAETKQKLIEKGFIPKTVQETNYLEGDITTGICNAIVKAQNTTIKVGINDEGLQQLDERNTKVINCLTELLDNHRAKVAVLLERQRQEIADITRRTEGVHFSKKVFFWLAGIWFTSVGVIIIELTLGILWLFGLMD